MILDRILETKRQELGGAKSDWPESRLRDRPVYSQPRRGFADALRSHQGRRIIAEIKRASPSRGTIRADFRPAEHAADYEKAGACCLSVLTDRTFFQGSLRDLEEARSSCSIPLLRKDFILDPYQIVEARSWGADAVLLIVAALDSGQLHELLACAEGEGLDVLTEVHDSAELATAVDAGATLVGVNNRDLKTFETSLDITRRLMAEVSSSMTVVSESGFKDPRDLSELEGLGVSAFLVGEHFMAASEPGQALRELLEST